MGTRWVNPTLVLRRMFVATAVSSAKAASAVVVMAVVIVEAAL
jgi:hypothetical protein